MLVINTKGKNKESFKLFSMQWTIFLTHVFMLFTSGLCVLGLALRSVHNIFILQMTLVVLTIITLLKLRWISVID